MSNDSTARSERALRRLEGTPLMRWGDPRPEPISLPHQVALAALVDGEVERKLASTFVHNLSWAEELDPGEEHGDRVIIGTTDRPLRLLAIRREVSSWHETYRFPGTSPRCLREAADRIERLLTAGLLEEVTDRGWPSGTLYQMPSWLWDALLDVLRCAAESQAVSQESPHGD